ncbi:hypothetical protein V6N13_015129 [Hibiscus sabdariffa]
MLSDNLHDFRPEVFISEDKSLLEEDASIFQGLEAFLGGFVDELSWRGRTRTGGLVQYIHRLLEIVALTKSKKSLKLWLWWTVKGRIRRE